LLASATGGAIQAHFVFRSGSNDDNTASTASTGVFEVVSGALLGVVASSVPLSGNALQPPTASAFRAEWAVRVEPAARERELATPAPASSQSGMDVALVGAVAAMGVAIVVAIVVWRARKRGTSVGIAELRRGLEQALQEAQAAFEHAYPLLGQSEPLVILAQYGGPYGKGCS
jgi:hypothetical protein